MEVFDPVQYSIQENEFLREFVGVPPTVALKVVPSTVNPRAVKPVLDRVYELVEEEKHTGQAWCGVQALKDAIDSYLSKQERWVADRKRSRSAPRFPTMHSYDAKRRPHYQGPGSDSGQVRTYINAQGERVPFAVSLIDVGEVEWQPEWATVDALGNGIKVDDDNKRIECLICGHTESFKPDSRSSYNAARGRISKHLRNAKDKQDEHRECHTLEFGSASVK